MAEKGKLIKIAETNVSSPTSVVSLTGIDTTYSVYVCRVSEVAPDATNKNLYMRVTKSGSPDSTSNYDSSIYALRSDTTFSTAQFTNGQHWKTSNYASSTGTGQTMQGLFYLFNFPLADYSYVTNETTSLTGGNLLIGGQGGGVHTAQSASDGISFHFSSDNIASGKFVLYGLQRD